MKSKGRGLWLAAPSLLAVVACVQFYLAQTASLSPWKGGGFGMFSTVDAPSARFLRVYLIHDADRVPVLIPESLQSLAMQVRTLPRQTSLKLLAEKIADGTWVASRYRTAVRHYLDLSGVDDLSRGLDDGSTDRGISSDDRPLVFGGVPLLRMLAEEEALRMPAQSAAFDRVHVELWRYEFDAVSTRLKAFLMLEVIVDRNHPVH